MPLADIAEIRRALAKGGDDEAVARAMSDWSKGPGLTLRPLKKPFDSAGRNGLLCDLVWRNKQNLLSELSRIAEYIAICQDAGRPERVDALLAWLSDPATPPTTVGHRDFLNRFKLDDDRLQTMLAIKYRGWDDDPSRDLGARIAGLASRCETQPAVLDAVIGHVCNGGTPSKAWFDSLRSSQACAHVFRDANIAGQLRRRVQNNATPFLETFCESLSAVNLFGLVDRARWRALFETLDLSHGLVVATCHDAFARLAIAMFSELLPDSYAIHLKDLPDSSGYRNAAFRALKTVTGKKAVLIAPDGQQTDGNALVEIDVLGQTVTLSAGAALIAYEGNAGSAFYYAHHTEEGFLPVFISGPRRETGESFAAFRERWLAFYAAAYQSALIGSPADLAMFLSLRKV